ncbi:MAG TPA: hypothetical protein GXZ82_09195 [Firmicutes bacterium]|jgi:hypothetical protein|nr:hypothetical protein [Bacillota bacterium]
MYGGAPWGHAYVIGPHCCPWHRRDWEMAQQCRPQWPMGDYGRPYEPGPYGEPSWLRSERRDEPWSGYERKPARRPDDWWMSEQDDKHDLGTRVTPQRSEPEEAVKEKPKQTPEPEQVKWPVAPELLAMADGGAVELPNTADTTTTKWHDLGQLAIGKQLADGVAVFTLSANIWLGITEIPDAAAEDAEQTTDPALTGVQITFRVLDPRGEVLASRHVEYAPGWSGCLPPGNAGTARYIRFPIAFELYARYAAFESGETLQLQASLTAEPGIAAVIVKDLQWSALLWPQTC